MSDPTPNRIEALADLEHKRWAGWMEYLFAKCQFRQVESGSVATHRCKVCGALWRAPIAHLNVAYPEWQLVSPCAGKSCCYNRPMNNANIEKLAQPLGPKFEAVIPPDLVERWQRQIDTAYADLSEKEKESDRVEVRKTLALLRELGVEV